VTLHGRGKLERKDKFAVAGVKTEPIEFRLRSMPEMGDQISLAGNDRLPNVRLGVSRARKHSGFKATAPNNHSIRSSRRTGRVERLRVGMKTMMWTKRKSSGFMPGLPITFHLAPPADKESTSPANEWGTITGITWDETYGLRTPEPADDAPPPKPATVELPARRYWMLGTIIAIGAVIAALLFLRH